MTLHIHATAAALPPRQQRRPPKRVVHEQVDRRVWALARHLADGDMRRVQIISTVTVVVWNHHSHRKDSHGR